MFIARSAVKSFPLSPNIFMVVGQQTFKVESRRDLGLSLCCTPGRGLHDSQYSGFVLTVLLQKDVNVQVSKSDHREIISSVDTYKIKKN